MIHDVVSIGGGVTVAALTDPANAQFRPAQMYAAEKGITFAYMWRSIAPQSGFSAAGPALDYAASQMTQEQIGEAEQLERICLCGEFENCD